MTPGVSDGPRNTGTLPKSNRRNDTNREVISSNEQLIRSAYYGRPQHSNNLLDWQPVSDREPQSTTKNSNTRTTSSVPPISRQDFTNYVIYGESRQQNYPSEDYAQWQDMAQPIDSRAQSPHHAQGVKPMNVDQMPNRHQVESRLNQIRDYIRVTSTMMESLSQSNDPRASTQYENLSRMVEDLCDSETKLTNLLENYRGLISEFDSHSPQSSNQVKRFAELTNILSSQDHFLTVCDQRNDENGVEESVESQLRKKMEASQRKLAELQDHQANLVGMQLRVRERLNEARQAQQALLLQENHVSNASSFSPGWDNETRPQQQLANDTGVSESGTTALKGKLAALQNKKKQMDSLVAEFQAVEMSERASNSSENSRYAERDKVVELETLKQQLAHLKGLMEEATRVRDSFNPTSEQTETAPHTSQACYENGEVSEEEVGAMASRNSFDHSVDAGEVYSKFNNSTERLTVDQIQAVTRELKEQQTLLQSARAELQRLKNSSDQSASLISAPVLTLQVSTPPSFLEISGGEKKSSNNINVNGENAYGKMRELEDLARKNHSQLSSANRDSGSIDWGSRRGSNSHLSHSSTSANVWPLSNAVAGISNEQSVDGISTAENLVDIGPQITTVESGIGNNWWNVPTTLPMAPPSNVGHTGSIEYYRQLLMGSQAQQLQMMSTTMQQCCQLLWSQQRELQSMRAAITQLQQYFRQMEIQPRITRNENEGYSNLTRSTHHLDNTLDASLPPSSSLPNLVSLPTASSTIPHPTITACANSQHHNNQQLNNQVPPGNRANNYWDNFRSYSRQNLLSENPKSVPDSQPALSSNSSLSTNTASVSAHAPQVSDAQYSLNLQLPSSNLQMQDREIPARNNILSNEPTHSQQVENFWEEAHSSFRLVPESSEDIYSLRHLSGEMRDILLSLIAVNRRQPDYLVVILKEIKAICEDQRLRPRLLRSLRALYDTQSPNNPMNETIYQTASESCQSSDDDSEIAVKASSLLNTNPDQSLITEFVVPTHSIMQGPQSMPALLVDHFEFEVRTHY
ncbi:hypothetical protein PV328_001094 [Microctonus aethiopoides]|uniref:Pericentriolar material 1 protein n=1 Tax=Microctonus aethiopoides TaxID=144406 RepID=A0AA39FW82_9HYME|nr:hypothetical protein PV328_001094 [Microctonus aethiopoides]